MKNLDSIIRDTAEKQARHDLALGYLRYETIRRLTPRQFSELHRRNINSGENFDEIVDELVIKNYENQNF